MNRSTYEKQLIIDPAHGDFSSRMSVSGMLREAQFVALQHCDSLGFGEAYMDSVHRAFLLTKLQMDILRAPSIGECVTLRTTAYCPDRILYPRRTCLYDASGTPLVEVRTVWVFVDTQRLRIMRKAPEIESFPFEPTPAEPWEIAMPVDRALESAEPVRVRYSMVDKNCHLNHAAYADIVCDALEDALFGGAQIQKFSIIYHREAKPGAVIELGVSRESTNAYVAGTIEGAMCFEAALDFSAEARPVFSLHPKRE